MIVLALETSTKRGGAALIRDGQVLAEAVTDRQRSHSELLHGFAQSCLDQSQLQLSDIDVFATSRGPGSFTGIRVAGNAAKAYAYAMEKPLVMTDSLTILAAEVGDSPVPVLAALNAFKNMVYYGIFEVRKGEVKALQAPTAATIPELLPLIDRDMLMVGEAYEIYKKDFSPVESRLRFSESPLLYPSPAILGLWAENEAKNGRVLSWNDFVPLYLRASEAEESRRGVLFQPVTVKEQVNGKTR